MRSSKSSSGRKKVSSRADPLTPAEKMKEAFREHGLDPTLIDKTGDKVKLTRKGGGRDGGMVGGGEKWISIIFFF